MFYIPIIFLWIIVFISMRRENELVRRIISRKKQNPKEKLEMVDLCKRFIGKDCIIYTYNSQIIATLKEVTDGAVLIERNGEEEAVNLDYIMRLREHPKNKKGKKKSIVVD